MQLLKYTLIASLFFMIACGLNSRADLLGHWTAISVIQADKPLDVEHNDITLSFTDAGTYNFTSTLNYKEAGSFKFEGDKLITRDTFREPHTTKIVIIEKLVSDTLRLRMRNEGEWMQLTMVK